MQLEQIAEKLQKLGLNDKQARVYAAALFLGPAPAQKIAEQAGINRPTAYDVLEELSKLGLITHSNDSARTVFIPTGTTGLKDLLKKQIDEVTQRQQELDALLPQLEHIERTDIKGAPVVRFVHGKAGVDAIWSYVLRKVKPGTEVLGMTNHDETLKVYPAHLVTNPQIRLSKKLSSKQFYFNSEHVVSTNPALRKEAIRLSEPPAADITLYDDKAVLLSYGQGKRGWTGIIIENKEIVESLRQLFYIAWGAGVVDGEKVSTDVDNV